MVLLQIPGATMSNKELSHVMFFCMQSGVSLLTMMFSIYMMSKSQQNIQTFLPILTSVAAYWLPAPTPPATIANLLRPPKTSVPEKEEDEQDTVVVVPHDPPAAPPSRPNPPSKPIVPRTPSKQYVQVPQVLPASTGSLIPPRGVTLQGGE